MRFGIEVLDSLFGEVLTPPAVIVVAGHPGSGKTTLASTICYANALRGGRCLYISFQEDKEKLFKNMKSLGVDLELVEKEGMLTFIRFPIVLSPEELVEEISKTVTQYKPAVIVVDSINVVLMAVSDEARRAWLQNYFYELPTHTASLMVLVAELPFGAEQLGLGSIEFVVDAVFILKHRIENGRLVRVMEVRKARGTPSALAEIPFAIVPGVGLKVYLPPILEEIPPEGEPIRHPCRLLGDVLGDVRRGFVVYLSYPATLRPPEVFLLPLGYAIVNGARVLFVSFRASPKTIRMILGELVKDFVVEGKSVEKFIDERFTIKSFNPFALSGTELTVQLIEAIDSVRPDIAVLHAFDIFAIAYRPRHFQMVYNIVNYIKSKNILTFLLSIRTDKNINTTFTRLSDVVIVFRYRYTDRLEKRVYIYRRGRDPYMASGEELKRCRDDIASLTV